jgi:PDZ domain-containing secreted protein
VINLRKTIERIVIIITAFMLLILSTAALAAGVPGGSKSIFQFLQVMDMRNLPGVSLQMMVVWSLLATRFTMA